MTIPQPKPVVVNVSAPSPTVRMVIAVTSTTVTAPTVVEVAPGGVPGRPGGRLVGRAAAPITAGQVLYPTAAGVVPASSLDPDAAGHLTGVATTSVQPGVNVTAVAVGPAELPVAWPPGTELYLGVDGYPTPSPDSGRVQVRIGHVHAPGVLHVQLGLPIVRPPLKETV